MTILWRIGIIKHMKPPQQLHIPVLFDTTMSILAPVASEKYLDLTAGYGGHAREIISRIGGAQNATLVDRDENAIRELSNQCGFANARFLHSDFLAAAEKLRTENQKFDMILMDLGVSSPQIDKAERGFSFQKEAALDMRMDESQELSAYQVVNQTSEKKLSEYLFKFGDESPKMARKIAHSIVLNRPIKTTKELANVVIKVSPKRGKIHPATRTFQAVRIIVNDELRQIRETLPLALELLNSGGRIAVISFHSLEDVIVKNYFQEQSRAGYEATIKLLNKKPLTSDQNELVYNPRARSAKLRAAVKI